MSQVFSEIRNEHFSNVFSFLSQKARNLQTAYDVSVFEMFLSVMYIQMVSFCRLIHPLDAVPLLFCLTEAPRDGHKADEDVCVGGVKRFKTGTSTPQHA